MKPGPRRSLSQSDLLQAAFELFEQKGFAGVSVRGVAAAVGLTPTAMYTYFPSKDALLRAMVEELLAGVAAAPAAPRAPVEPGTRTGPSSDEARLRLVAAAIALRDRLRAHPGAIVLVTGAPLDGPNALAVVERLGEDFAAAGASADDAARAAHALLAGVLGHVALETAWAGASADAAPALWTDAPPQPVGEASARLGLRDGDDAEFRAAAERLVAGWVG